MTKSLSEYSRILQESFLAYDVGDSELEDLLLGRLDRIWLQMTPEERRQVDDVAHQAWISYELPRRMTKFWSDGALGHGPDLLGTLIGRPRGIAGGFSCETLIAGMLSLGLRREGQKDFMQRQRLVA